MDPWPLLNLHLIRSISQVRKKYCWTQFGRNVSWYYVRAILIKSKFKRLPSAMVAWWYDWMLKHACLGCTILNTYRVSFYFESTSQQEDEPYSQSARYTSLHQVLRFGRCRHQSSTIYHSQQQLFSVLTSRVPQFSPQAVWKGTSTNFTLKNEFTAHWQQQFY